MGRLAKYSRRAFLVGSAAIAGGVAFGGYLVMRRPPNPLAEDLPEGAASFNPWVLIDAGGITLITPHADVGQGVAAVQALLIAEEMDLEPGQFQTSFGPPAAAYWNTALGAENAGGRDGDDSRMTRAMQTVMGGAFKALGMQITGGSSTVPDSYTKLRVAGAVARETLKEAAARRLGLPRSELGSGGGAVILPGGTRLAYTELAAEAAAIPAVEDVSLRAPSDWRLLGRETQRMDIADKSTGVLQYGIDLRLDGMIHAAVRLGPAPDAPLLSNDANRAAAMRDVIAVQPYDFGIAVLARNTWAAMQAAAAIECSWGPPPCPPDQDGHWDLLSASFNRRSLDREWRADGDADAMDAAISAEYRAPYLAHQPLEPLNATVLVTDERVEVWTAHQMPRFLQSQVAKLTGHKAAQVVLHNLYAGGSFGHRLELRYVEIAAQIADRWRGTPVKLTFDRSTDFQQDFVRPIGMARGVGAVSGGQVTGLDLQIASPPVSRSQFGRLGMPMPGPDNQLAAGAWNAPYAIPDFRVRAYAVDGLAPTSSWRSVGASMAGFFLEGFLDEVIHEAGADPLEERLRLAATPRARAVLEAVAQACDWQGPQPAPGVGRGVALVESFGVPVAEVVEVESTGSGLRITRVWVAAEVGRVLDPVNFENQVQGGVIWGLGHAMNCQITYAGGAVEQTNFHAHAGMRLYQAPEITVLPVETGEAVRGIGEPPVPPAAPALANAIFAATGQRLREMPFDKFVRFV
ncbi:MAG: molybdopterin-dependent oxidoreductase [Paracoccus sp. (in: a-proteobacteria)]|nr:molybdopterin-dependent oxidoreductase [Paracoccus sp. (in: a-proteobacteria)]